MGAGASAAPAAFHAHFADVPDDDAMLEKYDIDISDANLLGEGQFGRCYRCALRDDPSQKFAVKVVPMANLQGHQVDNIKREIIILHEIRAHPNVLHLYDYFEDKCERVAYIVTDLLEGGELFDRLLDKVIYSEHDARQVVLVMLEACSWLHGRGLCHRDFKPENLILASKDDDTTIHLVDFGLAAHVDDERAMKSQCGTPQFLAPEIVEGNPPYGPKTDCWAVGVIAYNLLHGLPPFDPYNDMDQGALFDDIRRNNWKFDPVTFDHVSDEAKDLIAKLMTKDVESRLTAEQALLHPWFQMGEHALVVKHLDETYQNLKTWNARRKLRQVAHTVRTSIRMERMARAHADAAPAPAPACDEAPALPKQPSTHLVGSGGVTPYATPAATPANSPPAVARELEASSSAPQLEDRS